MSEPHIIRLRGPWDAEPVDGSQATRWIRRFGRPTGLETGARVWLCLQPGDGILSWRLNDSEPHAVDAAHAVQRFDITDQLQPRNRLEVLVELGPNQSSEQPPFEAWLEIVARKV
jgi:hypothetical protein